MSNQLQNKLLHYEVPPPVGVWNKIAPLLDTEISSALSEKLYQYEEEPAIDVWQNIDQQLKTSPSKDGKVIPFYIRYKTPLKYSGAVAVFIFLAVLTSLLISKKTESELPAKNIVQNNVSKKNAVDSPGILKKPASLFSEKEESKSSRIATRSNISQNRSPISPRSFSLVENFLPRQVERNSVISPSSDADKYIIYTDSEGNVIRLPKKIFSAFVCPADDMICKQRLQRLREKFAASAMTADFNGLLQILKSLQENQ